MSGDNDENRFWREESERQKARADAAEASFVAAEERADAMQRRAESAESDWQAIAAENAKLREAQQWIPVSERLPAEGQRVIASHAPIAGVVFAPTSCTFERGHWCNDNWHRDVELNLMNYWMPMPDAPVISPTPEGEATHGR